MNTERCVICNSSTECDREDFAAVGNPPVSVMNLADILYSAGSSLCEIDMTHGHVVSAAPSSKDHIINSEIMGVAFVMPRMKQPTPERRGPWDILVYIPIDYVNLIHIKDNSSFSLYYKFTTEQTTKSGVTHVAIQCSFVNGKYTYAIGLSQDGKTASMYPADETNPLHITGRNAEYSFSMGACKQFYRDVYSKVITYNPLYKSLLHEYESIRKILIVLVELCRAFMKTAQNIPEKNATVQTKPDYVIAAHRLWRINTFFVYDIIQRSEGPEIFITLSKPKTKKQSASTETYTVSKLEFTSGFNALATNQELRSQPNIDHANYRLIYPHIYKSKWQLIDSL